MALTDILHTARDALAAQSLGLSVTGQNVANVNTPGYVRRQAILQSNPLGNESYGSVDAFGLRRAADLYTEQRHYASVGVSAGAQHKSRLLGHVEALFDLNSGLDVGTALDELFSSFSTLAGDPANLALRENVLGKASAFASRLNGTAESVAAFRTDLAEEAVGVAADINRLTGSIASVTEKISGAEVLGHDAADLKDQRDGLLLELSEFVDVRVFNNNQGQLVVQGAGTTLVEGGVARRLEVGLQNDGTLKILAKSSSGASTDISRLVQSGKLGSIRELHDTHTSELLASLDQFALDIASAVNNAHANGYAPDGSAGGDFFDVSAGPAGLARSLKLSSSVNAENLAAATTAGGAPGDGSNALLLAQLREQPIVQGSRNPAQGYGDIVFDVGSRKATADNDAELREGIESQLFAMRESMGGVSLDEEMISLTKYQRAYEAASRVITTVDELLADLMRTLGR